MARPKCLLLVDVDPERQAVVRNAMRRRADLVLIANSVAEARRWLEQQGVPVDWLLIDLGMDGSLGFAEEIRTRHGEIGIVLSGSSLAETGFPLLSTPYSVNELWAVFAGMR